MPVTTYLSNEPQRHDDEELAKMIDELNEKTGERWCVLTRHYPAVRGGFRKKKAKEHTELFKHLHSIEYQILTCVGTVGEAKAYLFGALGAWDKMDT